MSNDSVSIAVGLSPCVADARPAALKIKRPPMRGPIAIGDQSMTVVSKGQTLTTTAGQVLSGVTVSSGGTLVGVGAITGASTDAGLVSGVSLGLGSAGDTSTLTVLSGGVARAITVKAGATGASVVGGIKINAGGVDSAATINSGGAETVSSGGISVAPNVSSGGIELALAGGSVSGATVSPGGLLSGAGQVSGYTLILGSAAGITYAGSSGLGTTPVLEIAGSAASVTVSSGTIQIDRGGLAVGDHIVPGAVEHVELGGRVSGSVISSGALTIFSGFGQTLGVGEATSVTVSSGGVVELVSAFISSGASLPAAGVAASATTYNGVTVASGGEIEYLVPEIFSGHTLTARSADAVNGALVLSGAALVALSGAEVDGTFVSSGGTLTLSSGAIGGNGLVVSAGGVVSGAGAITGNGVAEVAGTISGVVVGLLKNSVGVPVQGHLEIQSGGAATAVSVAPVISAYIQIDSGAKAKGDIISNNASEFVKSGGVVAGTSILSGGNEYVSAGGLASGAIVLSSGTQNVLSGGVASASLVSAGGLTVANSGAKVIGATVAGAGAVLGVTAGGDALNAKVQSGGALVLLASGLASAVQISSGGAAIISSGATALALTESSGGSVINNGVIDIAGSGVTALSGTLAGSGGLVFSAASSTLNLGAPATPAAGGTFVNTLSNFARASDAVDLASLAFVSGATVSVTAATGGGTLTLTDGGKTYAFKLLGSVASAYAVGKDTGTGTVITVKTASLLAQAAAGFGASAGGAAEAVPPIAGGETRPLLLAAANGWSRVSQA